MAATVPLEAGEDIVFEGAGEINETHVRRTAPREWLTTQ